MIWIYYNVTFNPLLLNIYIFIFIINNSALNVFRHASLSIFQIMSLEEFFFSRCGIGLRVINVLGFLICSYTIGLIPREIIHFTAHHGYRRLPLQIPTSRFTILILCYLNNGNKKSLLVFLRFSIALNFLHDFHHLFCHFCEHSDHVLCPFIFGFFFY